MLNRNNSDDRLEATTALREDSSLKTSLTDAKPRSCLAVLFARTHNEDPEREPLTRCEVCGKTGRRTTCEPLLVGGEVIGSVLVEHDEPLQRTRDRGAARIGLAGSARARKPAQPRPRRVPRRHRRAHRPAEQARRPGHDQAHGRAGVAHALAAERDRPRSRPLQADQRQLRPRTRRRRARRRRRGARPRPSGRATSSDATAAKSSSCCCPTPTPSAPSSRPRRSAPRSPRSPSPAFEREITASLGIAAIPEHAGDGDQLVRSADRALYVAKTNGRNRTEIAVPNSSRDPEPAPLTA